MKSLFLLFVFGQNNRNRNAWLLRHLQENDQNATGRNNQPALYAITSTPHQPFHKDKVTELFAR